jgi:hypothetical protein
VWGARYAHEFDAGNGIGIIGSIGGGAGGMQGDTTAIHVSGMLSTGKRVTNNLSVCAGAGFDGCVTMGATAAFSRFSVDANYRNGDRSLGEAGRFGFSTGVSF